METVGLHLLMQHQQNTAESHAHGEGVHSVIVLTITLFACANTSNLSFHTILFKFWITRLEGKVILQPLYDCDAPREECDLKSTFSVFCESIVFTMIARPVFPWSPGSFLHFLYALFPLLLHSFSGWLHFFCWCNHPELTIVPDVGIQDSI